MKRQVFPSKMRRHTLAVSRALAVLLMFTTGVTTFAQSLDERLDERRYLEGLKELDLQEVLEHYQRDRGGVAPEAGREEAEVIAAQRAVARDSSKSVAERATAVERLLAERASQIENVQDGEKRVVLLADQAADLYFELLAIEASGWTSILGVPSDSQRERAVCASQEMHELAQRAEIAVEQAILDIERSPGFAENLNLQRDRRRLIEQERDRRIPLLLGLGSSLRAHVADDGETERDELFASAITRFMEVAPRLDHSLAAEAAAHAGLASAALGRVDDAERFFDAADTDDAPALARFAARLGRATLRQGDTERALERIAAYPEYSQSIFYRLLIADQLFAHKQDRDLREAVRAYAALLPQELDVDRSTARAIILPRIANAVDKVQPRDHDALPPFAVIAAAERELRSGSADPKPVEDLLSRGDLTEVEHAHAHITLGRVHHRDGDYATAAEHFLAVARDHSSQPESEESMERALLLAAEGFHTSPAEARDVLHEALTVALRSFRRMPSIDRWKFVAARLALGEARFDEAVEYVDSIPREHELWIDGRVLRVDALCRAAMMENDARRQELVQRALQSADDAQSVLQAAMSGAHHERAQALARDRLRVRILRATVLTISGEAERAINLLEDIERDPVVTAEILSETIQARIAAYRMLNQPADAQHEIDRLIEQDPRRVASVLAPMLASIEQRVTDLQQNSLPDRAREIAHAELAPLASRLDAWMREQDRRDAALMLQVADAYRLSDEHQSALRLYETLLQEHPSAAPLLFGKAECLYVLGTSASDDGQLGEAMALYRRIVAAGVQLGETYWQAQLRSLQILDQTNRNTHQIAPQIQRLRLRDPELGGDRLRVEFDRLQNKHAG